MLADESFGSAILSFSGGKDSLGAWLAMRRAKFSNVVPIYLYRVPGLEFVEQALAFYEDYFETPIVRLPHPTMHRLFLNGGFQTPATMKEVEKADLPEIEYDDLFDATRIDFELGADCLAALGIRASDNPNRWSSIKQRGPVNRTRRTWYPIYDWSADRLREELVKAKLPLPVDYPLFGRSFDGLDARFMIPLRKHFPDDYERIRAYYPLIDAIIYRHEWFWPASAQAMLDAVVLDNPQSPRLTPTRTSAKARAHSRSPRTSSSR